MQVRAKLTLRNQAMLAAREARGWTQQDLADATGIAVGAVQCLEYFHYRRKEVADEAERVAAVLDLDIEAVWPTELRGQRIDHTVVRVSDIPPRLLAPAMSKAVAYLPRPERELDSQALQADIAAAMDSLSGNEKMAIEQVFGLNGNEPRDETALARELGITRQAVCSRIKLGLRRLSSGIRKGLLGRWLDGSREPSRQELEQTRKVLDAQAQHERYLDRRLRRGQWHKGLRKRVAARPVMDAEATDACENEEVRDDPSDVEG